MAVLHAMVIRVIVNGYRTGSCLEVSTTSARADHTVQGLDAFRPATALDAKREAWAKRLPSEQGEIWDYLQGVADKYRLRPHIRFNTKVSGAQWDDDTKRWEVTTEQGSSPDRVIIDVAVTEKSTGASWRCAARICRVLSAP